MLVSKDTEKKFTVSVKSASGLPAGTTTKDIILTVIANAFRGTDGAGLTQNAPTAALSTRTITVEEGDTANLEVSAHTDNPKAKNVIINSTTETAGVTLAIMNVKATGNDAILRSVTVTDTDDSLEPASGTLSTIYLYDGSTLLSSSGTSTLSNIDLNIPKDTTKVLTLKGDAKKSSGNYPDGATGTLSIAATTTGFDAEDASSFAAATVSGSAIAPGAPHYYVKAPTLELASASIVGIEGTSGSASPQQAEAKIRVNVTANGGDIYVQNASATSGSSGVEATTSAPASLTVVQTFSSNATAGTNGWLIPSGDTRWFEATVNLTATAGAGNNVGFFANASLVNLIWTDADEDDWALGMPQTWGLTDLKTGDIFLQQPI
jgi:hypothetical protein